MFRGTGWHWQSLEHWSSTACLVAGGFMFGHAFVSGVEAFTRLTVPPDVFVTVGHFVALLGLIGLYPALVSRPTSLPKIAAGLTGTVAAGWAVVTTLILIELFVGLPNGVETAASSLAGATLLATILSYLLFGLILRRADADPPASPYLVVAPAVPLIALFPLAAVLGVSALNGLVVGAGMALALVALGVRLRANDSPANATRRDTDVAIR